MNIWFRRVREYSILEVISALGFPLANNGNVKIRSRCILSDHPGKNKSGRAFVVDTEKNVWYCHGCKRGGGNIEIVKMFNGNSVIESADFIARLAGMESFEEIKAATAEEKAQYRQRAEEKAIVYEILMIAAHHFHSTLTPQLRLEVLIPQGTFAPKETWENVYGTWGLTEQAIEEHLIGFDDSTLLKYLRDRNFSDRDIIKSGLFYLKNGRIGESVFKNRLTFPCREMGRVVNFIARSTSRSWPCYTKDPSRTLKRSDLPYTKYKKLPQHSTERPYISKAIQSPLFGIEEIRRKKNTVIVEGVPDVILMRMFFQKVQETEIREASQWGVGSFLSNQISQEHISQLIQAVKDQDTLLFLCDSEKSERGRQGALNAAKKLLAENVPVLIGELPLDDRQKLDPALWVRDQWERIENSPQEAWESFTGIVHQAQNIIDITIERADEATQTASKKASRSYLTKLKKQHVQEILELIMLLPELEQEDYLTALTAPPFNYKLVTLKRLVKTQTLINQAKSAKPEEANAEFSFPGIIPDGWQVNSTGLYQEIMTRSKETHYIKIAEAPIIITEKYYDIDAGQYYLKAAFYEQGHWLYRTESREIFMSNRKLPELAKWGFPTNTENSKRIVSFLTEYEAANRETIRQSQVVSSCGNKTINGQKAFVLGRRSILKDREEPIEFLTPDVGDQQIINAFEAAGNLDLWIEMLKRCIGYDGVMLAIYATFCGPVLELLRSKGFTYHTWGRSSIGKTILLNICASIWGDPSKLLQSWNQREVATERRMAICNETAIFLDELKQAIRKEDIERTLYAVTNGHGRGRGSLKGQQKTLFWQLVLLSTGEMPATHTASDEGGQARVINVRDHLFGPGNRDLVRELELIARHNYGLAGAYFVRHADSKRIQERHQYYLKMISKLAQTDIAYRIGNNLAVILAVGDEVNEMFSLTQESAGEIVGELIGELLQEASTIDRANAALTQVVEWALANEGMFFPHTEFKKDIAGVWKEHEYLAFFPYRLRKILDDFGFNYDAILRDWADRGWIKHQRGRKDYPISVNNRKIRMVAINWFFIKQVEK